MKYILVLLLGVFLSQSSIAHDFYSPSCCSGKDCHPIESCDELTEEADGSYTYGKYHFRKDQVHPSEDGKCHVCIYDQPGFPNAQTPMCVYIQQGT